MVGPVPGGMLACAVFRLDGSWEMVAWGTTRLARVGEAQLSVGRPARDTAWAMSQENVEVVGRNQDAWNRCDLRTWLASFRSDGEIDWSRSRGPLKGVYRGHGELKVFWDEFWSTFDDVQVETYGVAEAGCEVVVSNTAHVRGRQGIEVVARSTFVFTVENGQVTRQRLFQERAEALEAAGLSE